MGNKAKEIDLVKLSVFILKRAWLLILCAELGFGAFYLYYSRFTRDMYTATGMMYVNNGNPNLETYQYTNENDLNSAVQLIETYQIVIKSEKVMKAVMSNLSNDYPGISAMDVATSLAIGSVSETGVVSVRSRTNNPQLSRDIVNAVLDSAPAEIIRVVGAGNIEIIDYATAPLIPDSHGAHRKGMIGGAIGVILAAGVLTVLFLLNQRVADAQELKDLYNHPILSSIPRALKDNPEADDFLLTDQSELETVESYAKLRMNLLYTLVGKGKKSVVITSSISGEGKSTIASNLAISCAMGNKKVLLVDGDLRRACQRDIFKYDKRSAGLSDILVGKCQWREAILKEAAGGADLLPAGHFPPNPAELLETDQMSGLLNELEKEYELLLIDMPPINVVADPLVLAEQVAGCLFVTRQNFSDHRDIRKALESAEMAGMEVLGFIFYGEDIREGGYYSRHYYKSYYNKYDYRRKPSADDKLKDI